MMALRIGARRLSAAALALLCAASLLHVSAAASRELKPDLLRAGEDKKKKHKKDKDLAYGILLDAGSGSTKGGVWSWDPCYKEIPKLELVSKFSRMPALSSFAISEGGDPHGAGESLLQALEEAKEVIPKEKWPNTPVFLTATAGMRLIPEKDRALILRVVNIWLANPDNHPFLYGTRPPFTDGQFWAQTISGDDEGGFGFLDLNFLMGRLVGQDDDDDDEGEDDPENDRIERQIAKKQRDPGAFGWIDTGGASLQVSFAPQESSILGNVYPVSPLQFTHITNSTGSTYASTIIYSHSWNGLGQREARRRMQFGITKAARVGLPTERFSGGHTFSDPCLLSGQVQVEEYEVMPDRFENYTYVGSGDFYMCQWFVDDYVLNLREECLLKPCAAAGVYVPATGTIVFMGFRKMLELARPLGLAKKHGAWAPDSYADIESLVHQVCTMPPEEAHDIGIRDDFETDSGPCFRGVLMLRFLQTMGSPSIVFSDRIDSNKFAYTRGAMLSYIVTQDQKRIPGWPYCDKPDRRFGEL